MKQKLIVLFVLIILTFVIGSVKKPDLKDSFMNQKNPGKIPVLFAPGIVSTKFHEHSGLVISPQMDECFFTIAWYEPTVIINIKKTKGKWGKPEVATFSGQYSDGSPTFGPQGKRLYFVSKRPVKSGGKYSKNERNVWYVKKEPNGRWGKPVIHEELSQFKGALISFSNNGNFYFCKPKGKQKGWDIFRSLYHNGKYLPEENLGENINSKQNEFTGQIAPDESFLIFSSNRPENKFGMYISFMDKEGDWSKPKYFDSSINQGHAERYSTLSPDGRYLFFNRQFNKFPELHIKKKLTLKDINQKHNSPQNGFGDIYWVDAKIIENLKTK